MDSSQPWALMLPAGSRVGEYEIEAEIGAGRSATPPSTS